MSTIKNNGGHLTYPNLPIFVALSNGAGADGMTLTNSMVELTLYTNISINRGNHYNNSTCRFTCPVAGIYEFGMNFIAGDANDVYRFHFYKNGVAQNPQLRIDTTDSTNNDYETAFISVYLDCAKDDYVSIYGMSDGGSDKFSNLSYDYFQGRLIG
jgi:hypothetical protein